MTDIDTTTMAFVMKHLQAIKAELELAPPLSELPVMPPIGASDFEERQEAFSTFVSEGNKRHAVIEHKLDDATQYALLSVPDEVAALLTDIASRANVLFGIGKHKEQS
jgi:hypothetical protein